MADIALKLQQRYFNRLQRRYDNQLGVNALVAKSLEYSKHNN
jgi:hypothetical protein